MAIALGQRGEAHGGADRIGLGLRQGEVLGLRWEDLDLEREEVHVRRALRRLKGRGNVEVELKTDLSRRNLALPPAVSEALSAHRVRQDAQRKLAGASWIETGHVFTTAQGRPLDGSNVTHDFQQALSEAGLPRMRFYRPAARLRVPAAGSGRPSSGRHGDARPQRDLAHDEHL